MTSYNEISAGARGVISCWLLLLIFICIVNVVYCMTNKLRRRAFAALLLIVPIYSIFYFNKDLSEWICLDKGLEFTLTVTNMPAVIWFLAIAVLSVLCIIGMVRSFKWERHNMTVKAIHEIIECLPVGVCYYTHQGRIVLSNSIMKDICIELTGRTLSDGIAYEKATKKAGVLEACGRNWKFSWRRINTEAGDRNERAEQLNEMIAIDVTELEEKNRILEQENLEIEKNNINLKEYNLRIEHVVRQQEILQAKIFIHDEMNRLMLATSVAIDNKDYDSLDKIMSEWENNMLLMGDKDRGFEAIDNDITAYGRLQGIKVILQIDEALERLKDDAVKELLKCTAHEALANAAKHGNATEMVIYANANEFVFENNGRIPNGEITAVGGLDNLVMIAKGLDCKIRFEVTDKFRLVLVV